MHTITPPPHYHMEDHGRGVIFIEVHLAFRYKPESNIVQEAATRSLVVEQVTLCRNRCRCRPLVTYYIVSVTVMLERIR